MGLSMRLTGDTKGLTSTEHPSCWLESTLDYFGAKLQRFDAVDRRYISVSMFIFRLIPTYICIYTHVKHLYPYLYLNLCLYLSGYPYPYLYLCLYISISVNLHP